MPLILKIENMDTLPDGGPLSVELDRRGIDIGRDSYLDWTLPDPERFVSGKHCEVRYRDGGYWLHDVSTNGTTVNEDHGRLTQPHQLRQGDRIHIGSYIIAVSLTGADAAPAASAGQGGGQGASADPWGDIAGAAESVSRRDFQAQSAPPGGSVSGRPVQGDVTEEDFSWSLGEVSAPATGGADEIDVDWASPGPAAKPPAPEPAPEPAPPEATPPEPAPPQPERRVPLFDDEKDELELPPAARMPEEEPLELGQPPAAQPAPVPRPESTPKGLAAQWSAGQAEPEAPRPQPQPAAPSPAPAPAPAPSPEPAPSPAAGADWVAAFERGAGLPAGAVARSKGQDALAEELGQLFNLVAINLKAMLSARDETKNAMRSSQRTMIQAAENNPLKFSPTPEDALRIMFGEKTRSYLDARQTLEASFGDLKAHQLQTFTAMQQALQALIEDLDPEKIAEGTASDGGLAGIVSSRRAKLWDTYAERFKAKASRHERGMIDAFMILFAEMYDRQGRR